MEVAFKRGDRKRSASVKLARLPRPSPHDLAIRKFGFDVEQLTPQISRELYVDVDDGVLVSKILEDGAAAQRGIEVGDVIVQLGEYRVCTLDDIAIILDKIDSGDTVVLGFIRGQYIIRTRITAR